MRYFLSLLFILSFHSAIFSQEKEFKQVPFFDNASEAQFFKNLYLGDSSALEVFMSFSADPSTNIKIARTQISQFVNSIKLEKRPSSDEKYLKKVYRSTHDTFLKKYDISVSFDRLFVDGWYNCVTACALYGIVFKELGIPFYIKKTPTHVYIIAYPETDQILIETTDPLMGFKTFSPGFKEDFVIQLANLKLIDSNEAGTGVNNIFNTYYFTKENLGLSELAGLHFYNHGIYQMEGNDYLGASFDLEKAHCLVPDDKQVEDVYITSLAYALSNSSYQNMEYVQLLKNLTNFIGRNSIGVNEINGEFNRFLYFNLTNKNDTAFSRRGYELLAKSVTNEEVLKEIGRSYNYERARISYNRGKFLESFQFALQAYRYSPGNLDSENLLRASLANLAMVKSDTEYVLGQLEGLILEHKELSSNTYFMIMLGDLYLQKMGEAFDNRNVAAALSYKAKFENIIAENPGGRFNDYEIGKAYSKGCVYYFKKGLERDARAIVKKGLEYAPSNSELKSRQYMLNH